MKFEKGREKTGGRQKGTTNKKPRIIKQVLSDLVEDRIDEIGSLIDSITDPRDKLKAYLDILPYVTPKMQAVQADVSVSKQSSVQDDLKALSEE